MIRIVWKKRLNFNSKIVTLKKPSIWNICWFFVSPALLMVIVVLAFKDLKQIKLNNYLFPYWTHVLGQLITASTLSGVVFWAIYLLIDAAFINKRVHLFSYFILTRCSIMLVNFFLANQSCYFVCLSRPTYLGRWYRVSV